MNVDDHNDLLVRGRARALELEAKLADAIRPTLVGAGLAAARAFEARATDYLTASLRAADRAILAAATPRDRLGTGAALALTAAAPAPTSTMIALYPRPDEAAALAQPGGEPAGILHVTLAFLGDADPDTLGTVRASLERVAASHPPLAGDVGGIGAFSKDAGAPAIFLPDVPGLVELRVAVTEALVEAGADYSRDHGFLAHISVGKNDEPEPPPADLIGAPLHFDALHLVRGDETLAEVPLIGRPAITAAAGGPTWSAPAPDEILDVESLVQRLRTKTDPVRLAAIETLMTAALADAGISFDVTNPFTARVIAQAGSQIIGIARTTQLDVMRVIRESYDQGLSIPDTASAIRAAIREAAVARSVTIARTEMAGAVNGGSLAATQIVSAATGDQYFKVWLTAVGAKWPRHEDYDGLDGQTQPLDGYFDVGDSQLQHPGDPDGPAEDVVACRCTLAYSDTAEGL